MVRETFPVGLLGCNCTVLGDEDSREAIVIDPGYDIPRILTALAKHSLTLRKIVVTHAHIDHIASADELKRITDAPVFWSEADLSQLEIMDMQAGWLGVATPVVKPPDHSPADGELIEVNGIGAQVIYTPGHTEGSLCLHVASENLLLAGDTLFAGAVGRTDFPGGSFPKLLGSIRERLLPLPGETLVVPGHGAETTIVEERATNPFLS